MGTINITGVDLKEFAKKVYELSVPQGLGFLHSRPGPLSDKDATKLVDRARDSSVALSMDYIQGRACKMVVFKENGELIIQDEWFDHTPSQLEKLLKTFGKELHVRSGD